MPNQPSPDECYRCGYDLRGIGNDRPCPECGLLAERSRRVSDELHNTRPRWLRKLARGIRLILLALILLMAWPLVIARGSDWVYQWGYQSSVFQTPSWHYVNLVADLIPVICAGFSSAIFLLGILLLTAREQYGPADSADRRHRKLLRVLAVLPLLGATGAGMLIQSGQFFYIYFPMQGNFPALFAVILVGCIPLPVLLFYQLRSLAKRARSAHLAERCAIVGIGTSAAVCYAAAMIILFHFDEDFGLDPNWANRSSVALGIILVCTLSACLFALWSFYLLVRFAIAFHSAARQLRRKWKTDDRAADGLGAQ